MLGGVTGNTRLCYSRIERSTRSWADYGVLSMTRDDAIVSSLLTASGYLIMDGGIAGALDEFYEFLDVGELGLAFEALRIISRRRDIQGRFHAKMREAAELMGLVYSRETDDA